MGWLSSAWDAVKGAAGGVFDFLGSTAGGVTSNIIGTLAGGLGQQSANKANVGLAREQMRFQERMRDTSYQAAVKDLNAAGLNPMLAYSQGGAQVPQGAMARVENVAGAAVSSAVQGMQMLQAAQQIETNKAQAELIRAQTAKVSAETMPQSALEERLLRTIEKLKQDTSTGFQNQLKVATDTELSNVVRQLRELQLRRDKETFSADVARRKAMSSLTELAIPMAQREADYATNMGEMDPYLRTLLMILQGANSAKAFVGK